MVKAQVDAGACGTRSDFAAMDTAQQAYDEVYEKTVTALLKLVNKPR